MDFRKFNPDMSKRKIENSSNGKKEIYKKTEYWKEENGESHLTDTALEILKGYESAGEVPADITPEEFNKMRQHLFGIGEYTGGCPKCKEKYEKL
ncbi:MAG: hypothetical protein QXO12_03315 [Candidatus Pacearchaeota archaeon]